MSLKFTEAVNGDSPELINPTAVRPRLRGFAHTCTGPI